MPTVTSALPAGQPFFSTIWQSIEKQSTNVVIVVSVSKNTVLLRNICVRGRGRNSHAGYAVSFVLMYAAFCDICLSISLEGRPKRFCRSLE